MSTVGRLLSRWASFPRYCRCWASPRRGSTPANSRGPKIIPSGVVPMSGSSSCLGVEQLGTSVGVSANCPWEQLGSSVMSLPASGSANCPWGQLGLLVSSGSVTFIHPCSVALLNLSSSPGMSSGSRCPHSSICWNNPGSQHASMSMSASDSTALSIGPCAYGDSPVSLSFTLSLFRVRYTLFSAAYRSAPPPQAEVLPVIDTNSAWAFSHSLDDSVL